jgi:hypothetical protein
VLVSEKTRRVLIPGFGYHFSRVKKNICLDYVRVSHVDILTTNVCRIRLCICKYWGHTEKWVSMYFWSIRNARAPNQTSVHKRNGDMRDARTCWWISREETLVIEESRSGRHFFRGLAIGRFVLGYSSIGSLSEFMEFSSNSYCLF